MKAFAKAALVVAVVAASAQPDRAAAQADRAAGADARATGGMTTGVVSGQDAAFARRAALGGMRQVRLSQLAADQATSPEVRRFARQTVDAFQQARKELQPIAKDLGIDLPSEPGETTRALHEALAELSGDLFDREYMWNLVAASTVAVNVFEEEVEDGVNERLVGFAREMLPKLERHRDQAVQIWGTMDE